MTVTQREWFRKRSQKKCVPTHPDFLPHSSNYYEVLDVAGDASDRTFASAYRLKASSWQNQNSAKVSASVGTPARAVTDPATQ